MTSPLRRITGEEFARRLKATIQEADKRFAFLLGAGCSVSSGIPAAGPLVKDHWLPRLRNLCAPDRKDLDIWAKEQFPKYDPQAPSALYGDVMERLFLSPEERQREIERLCDGRFPAFGYAVLSSLVALEGGRFNVVLTTNFDDLMADGLYLFSQARPLVIHHESLASYIRPTRTRPLIVKLHGDHRLSPQNTTQETQALKETIEKQVRTLLHDRGLIFIGYGGNDNGIKEMLDSLPREALPLGVFWIGGKEPQGAIRPWLESRNAVWVEKGDFDELMLFVRDVFDLPHPDEGRFENVFERYKKTYDILSGRIVSLPDTAAEASALKEAVKRTDESLPHWWAAEVAARRMRKSDPNLADAMYVKGLEEFPTSAGLLASYAIFLTTVRKDHDRAEEYFRRALAADPDDANHLGNYGAFLLRVRKDYARAEEYFRRALAADSKQANTLDNYAILFSEYHKDYARAEEYFRRALAADPDDAILLGNYAGFLLARGRREEGLPALERALHHPAFSVDEGLAVECWFYSLAHRPVEGRREALRNLKQLLMAGARSPGWDFSENIAQARRDGNPDIPWLEKLAAVISEGVDVGILEAWDEWKMV